MGEHWTDERIETLKQLWDVGLSGSQIAERLGGLSRNAVIGKANRLGLASREKISLGAGVSKAPKARAATTRKAAPDLKAIAAVKAIIDRPPPQVIETLPLPKSLELSLLEVKDGDCRWPTGEKADITFCGHNIHEGKPYCAYHCRLAYNPRAAHQPQKTVADLVRKAA